MVTAVPELGSLFELALLAITSPVAVLSAGWSGLSGWFSGIWEDLVTSIPELGFLLELALAALASPISILQAGWSGLNGWFRGIWQGLLDVIPDFGSLLTDALQKIPNPADVLKKTWGAIGDFFGGAKKEIPVVVTPKIGVGAIPKVITPKSGAREFPTVRSTRGAEGAQTTDTKQVISTTNETLRRDVQETREQVEVLIRDETERAEFIEEPLTTAVKLTAVKP